MTGGPPGPDVLGTKEACGYLHVSKQRLAELRAREDFPAPRELACGPIWDRGEIHAWDVLRKRDRTGRRTRWLMSYRKLGSVYAAARAQEVPLTTAYRWAAEAGITTTTEDE